MNPKLPPTCEYKIVKGKDAAELAQAVQDAVADGWDLAGGLANDGKALVQALVKQ